MVNNQAANLHYKIVDITDIKKSNRYSRDRQGRGSYKDTFADSFEKHLSKTIDQSNQTEKDYLNRYPQRKKALGLERKPKTKDEIKIKPKNDQDEYREKVDHENKNIEKNQSKTENSYEENISETSEEEGHLDLVERKPETILKNNQKIFKDTTLGKTSGEISEAVILKEGPHLKGDHNRTQLSGRIDVGEKNAEPNKAVVVSVKQATTLNTEKQVETLQITSVLEDEKIKESKIEQLVGKKPDESAELKSTEKSNIILAKGPAALNKPQIKTDSDQMPVDKKNREMATPAKVLNETEPQVKDTGVKSEQSNANKSVLDIKTNPIELMPNTRAAKVDQNTITGTKVDSAQGKMLPEQSFDKIIKNLVYIVKNSQSEIKIDLRPELLGEMQVEIIAKNNRLNINITTDSNIIKEFIENSLSQLRTEFSNYKLSVEDIEVGVNNEFSKENDKHKGFEERPLWSSKGESKKKERSMDDPEKGVVQHSRPNRSNSMIDYYV